MLNRLIIAVLAIACIGLAAALLRSGGASGPSAPLLRAVGNPPIAAPAMDDPELDRRIKEVHFNNVGFIDAIETLSQMTGVNIFVQWPSLEGAGIDRMALVRLTLRNIRLGQALSEIELQVATGNARLAHRAADGVITIMTIEDWEKDVTLQIYDVRDLLDEIVGSRVAMMKKAGLTGPPSETCNEAMEGLEKLITDTISPEMWRNAGGTVGEIRDLGGLLFITLPPENQKQVAFLLQKIHSILKRHEPFPTSMPAAGTSIRISVQN